MDCPVCKYPNAQGATHCGMCYEVFNRSAAQVYLHAVKRERGQTEDDDLAPKAVIHSEKVVGQANDFLKKIDWPALRAAGASLWTRYRQVVLIAGGLFGVWIVVSFLLNANLGFRAFGQSLRYAFSDKAPAQYLIGMTQEIKTWSERQGRLDTPMEEFKLEELGNGVFDAKPSDQKDHQVAGLRTKEWIQILHDANGTASQVLPLNHPSLIGARIVFDKKGALLERRYTLSPRLAKALPFLTPKFPKEALHHGQTWTELVEWLDVYNEWKIHWVATLRWTMGDMEPCAGGDCARLTYQADLRPQLRGGPDWAVGAMKNPSTQASADGVALFDGGHKRLVANTFSYEGVLHIPIRDLGLIPWELRIGRRVKGPGDVVIRYKNKIEIRKN